MSHSTNSRPSGVNLFTISIFMIAQGFDAKIGGVEKAPVNAAATKAPIGIDLANEVEALALFGNAPYLFELATKEPEMAEED